MPDYIRFNPSIVQPNTDSLVRAVMDASAKASPGKTLQDLGTALGNTYDFMQKAFQQEQVNNAIERQIAADQWLLNPDRRAAFLKLQSQSSEGVDQLNQARETLGAMAGMTPDMMRKFLPTFDERLQNADKSRESVSENAMRAVQQATAVLTLKNLQEADTKKDQIKNFTIDLVNNPEKYKPMFEGLVSTDPAKKAEAIQLGRDLTGLKDPKDILSLFTLGSELFPQNKTKYEVLSENVQHIQDFMNQDANQIILPGTGGLPLQTLVDVFDGGIAEVPLKEGGAKISAEGLSKIVDEEKAARIVREIRKKAEEEGIFLDPSLSNDMIKRLMPAYIEPNGWGLESGILPGYYNYDKDGEYAINVFNYASDRGTSLYEAVKSLSNVLGSNKDLLRSLSKKTGIVSQLQDKIKKKQEKEDLSWYPTKESIPTEVTLEELFKDIDNIVDNIGSAAKNTDKALLKESLKALLNGTPLSGSNGGISLFQLQQPEIKSKKSSTAKKAWIDQRNLYR